MSDQTLTTEAEILLQVPSVAILEQVGPGTTEVLSDVELMVLSMTPSQAELDAAQEDMQLPPGTLKAQEGQPIIIILCGEYKIPLCPNIPCTKTAPAEFTFHVPHLYIIVRIAPWTEADLVEAFGLVVRTYSTLTEKPGLAMYVPTTREHVTAQRQAVPQTAQNGAYAPQHQQQQQPQWGTQAQPQWGSSNSNTTSPQRSPRQQQNLDSGSEQQQQQQQPQYQQQWAPNNNNHGPAQDDTTEQQTTARAMAPGGATFTNDGAQQQPQYQHQQPGAQPTMVQQWGGGQGQKPMSTRVASGIGTVSSIAMLGIRKGAGLVAKGIHHGSEKVVSNTSRCEQPIAVPAAIKDNVHRGRVVSKTAVAVSSGLSKTIIGVTSILSDQLSSHLKRGVPEGQEPGKLDAVKEVAVAALGGAAGVYDAATEGIREVVTAGSGGVTRVVTHKLGEEAGHTAEEGLGIVEDGIKVKFAAKVGVKGAVKGAAVSTVKQTAQKTFM